MTPGAPSVIRVGPRAGLALLLASVTGALAFVWPLVVRPPAGGAGTAHALDAPFVLILILPIMLLVVLAELSEGGMDAKALALLGVLSAVGAVLRPLGAGTAGLELVFFLLVLAGRVMGPGFGFVLGCTTLLSSAVLTAGVGPWMPFQMLAAAWVGAGAGLLGFPRLRGRREIALLTVYGAFSAYLYGLAMNLSFWPFAIGADTQLSFLAGAPVLENLQRFLGFTIATSAIGWDTGRAITNAVAIVVVGPAVLAALRRASRRAAFHAPVEFADPLPAVVDA